MVTNVEFQVAPELRLQLRRRGPRSPYGPRLRPTPPAIPAARLPGSDHSPSNGAPGEPADRDGHAFDEPSVRRWQQLAGGGLATPAATTDNGETATAWIGHENHLERMLSAHLTPVEHARRPIVPEPRHVSRYAVREQLRSEATREIPSWRVNRRLQAQREADQHLYAEVRRLNQDRETQHAAEQAAADEWWQRLEDAEPLTVMDQLNQGYERGVLPAGPTAVEGRTAHAVIAVDTPQMLIGDREPTTKDQRAISLAIMSESKRNKLYVQALCASVLQVAATSFALVPGIDKIDVAVVGVTRPTGPAVLMLAELPRGVVLPDDADRSAIDDLIATAQRGSVQLVLERSSLDSAPKPLDPALPAVAAALEAIEIS